jgi:peptidoglycan/xylan/chitin deacetylase (PgdA/CDA1 family)
MYHGVERVADDPFGLFVPPAVLAAQLRTLAGLGLRGVSLGELAEATARGEAAGLVGLTFDDGYRNVLTEALPVLLDCGVTATVFVVSSLLGGENVWDPPPRHRLLDAGEVAQLAAAGMEIGSHSRTHARLTTLDATRLHDEVAGSRAALADVTGELPRTFCYPYGAADAATVHAVRLAGYTAGCAVHRVPGLPDDLAAPRVGVTARDLGPRLAAKLVLRGR